MSTKVTAIALVGSVLALGRLADPASAEAIRRLAADYPEISTRKVLLAACAGKR